MQAETGSTGLRGRVPEAASVHHSWGEDDGGGGADAGTGAPGPGRRDGKVLRWRKPLLALVAALVTAAIQRAVYSAGKACPDASSPTPAYLPLQSGAL